MAISPELKDARRRIEEELETALDPERLKEIIDVALSTTKKAWGDFSCKGCGKHQRQMVEVPDSVSVAKVLETLMNQSMGRPQEAQDDQNTEVHYYVLINHRDGTDEVRHNGVVASAAEAARIVAQHRKDTENGVTD